MALTVGTNSYISVVNATAYFAERLYVDEWTGASSDEKEKALLMARRMLDQQPFLGERTDDNQLLAWPRTGITGVDPSTIPQAILDAQCELALAMLREDLTADDTNRGIKRMKAGSVELEYDGRAPEKRLPDAVLALLRPFLVQGEATANSIAMVL